MKKSFSALLIFASLSLLAQNIEGAWEGISTLEGREVRSIAIFSNGYQVLQCTMPIRVPFSILTEGNIN